MLSTPGLRCRDSLADMLAGFIAKGRPRPFSADDRDDMSEVRILDLGFESFGSSVFRVCGKELVDEVFAIVPAFPVPYFENYLVGLKATSGSSRCSF